MENKLTLHECCLVYMLYYNFSSNVYVDGEREFLANLFQKSDVGLEEALFIMEQAGISSGIPSIGLYMLMKRYWMQHLHPDSRPEVYDGAG